MNDAVISQSEELILNGCVGLLQELYDEFLEYLDFAGVHWDDEPDLEPIFCMGYQHIVKHLFLWHTNHCGGTSTLMKCKELGVDGFENIRFKPPKEEV